LKGVIARLQGVIADVIALQTRLLDVITRLHVVLVHLLAVTA
jgi:hypothetical protein